MFIRFSTYGKNKYCQIVESYRNEKNVTKHRIVMSLGKVDECGIPLDAERLSALAEQINLACGHISKEDLRYGQKKHNPK